MSCGNNVKIDVQGHRGCRGLMPENTLPAFEKAIDLGVNTLELDIAITKDAKVVVSHEPFMSRTICLKPNGEEIHESEDMVYNLYLMTHSQIQEFDCGSKYHPLYSKQVKLKTYKPLLAEVFALANEKDTQVKFNIEIKSKPEYYGIYTPNPKEYVALVLKTIKDNNMVNRSNLQSFDLNILEEINKQDPEIKVALLIDEQENIASKLSMMSFKPQIISPYYLLLSSDSVKSYQQQGYQVIPWTVNDAAAMQRMISYKVDGIITDYPNLLMDVLH